jgi:hypothetical protein
LRAIATLASANILPANYSNASGYADVWETNALPLFEVKITSATAASSLDNYVQKANLSEALLYGGGSLNGSSSSNSSSNGTSDLGWGDAAQLIGGNGTSTFYALSLKADYSPVEVGVIGRRG